MGRSTYDGEGGGSWPRGTEAARFAGFRHSPGSPTNLTAARADAAEAVPEAAVAPVDEEGEEVEEGDQAAVRCGRGAVWQAWGNLGRFRVGSAKNN